MTEPFLQKGPLSPKDKKQAEQEQIDQFVDSIMTDSQKLQCGCIFVFFLAAAVVGLIGAILWFCGVF